MVYSFIIRRAIEEDYTIIHDIIKKGFHEYVVNAKIDGTVDALIETPQDIKNSILEKNVFVALIDNIAIGTVRLEILDNHTAYLSRFAVDSSYRNIGVGKALMNIVDKYLTSNNVKTVFLHTASTYSDLMRFYYGRGFYVQSVSTDRGYYRAKLAKDYY